MCTLIHTLTHTHSHKEGERNSSGSNAKVLHDCRSCKIRGDIFQERRNGEDTKKHLKEKNKELKLIE